MTRVSLHQQDSSGNSPPTYRALSGDRQSVGRTAGEALDALVSQLPDDAVDTIVVVRHQRPDRYFDASQQRRLAELMDAWHAARDRGASLSPAEQDELDALVEAELRGSARRAAESLRDAAP